MDECSPYNSKEFAETMERLGPFEPRPVVALGLSGGADSMALMHLLKGWAFENGGSLVAFIVDHGLRQNSAAESALTARRCEKADVRCTVLKWEGPKPKTAVQASAREARYNLLREACRKNGILHLCLAQHLDDQLETFLLRLGRGSRLDGLSAMSPLRFLPDLRVLRPLLGVSGYRLRRYLQARCIEWIEDPSNKDHRYTRVRLRALLQDLQPPLAAKLQSSNRVLSSHRRLNDTKTAEFLSSAFHVNGLGFGLLSRCEFQSADRTLRMESLNRILRSLGRQPLGPRWKSVERLDRELRSAQFSGATLCGLRLRPRSNQIQIFRESRSLPAFEIRPGQQLRWDNRFDVSLQSMEPDLREVSYQVAALGRNGVKQIKVERTGGEGLDWSQEILCTLPALWDDSGLLIQPHLGYYRKRFEREAVFYADFCPEMPVAQLFTLV